EEWKAYRSEMRFKSYAPTERSEGAAITELINLSGGNHARQMQIVKQSMAKGWKGLFELKGGTERRDVNAISEPDTQIPPGFRGGPTH
ncbi:DNA replication domain protein, partial [Klebsiella pneumoniae]